MDNNNENNNKKNDNNNEEVEVNVNNNNRKSLAKKIGLGLLAVGAVVGSYFLGRKNGRKSCNQQ